MQEVQQGVASFVIFKLVDSNGAPVSTVPHADAQLSIRRDDEVVFQTRALDSLGWLSLGGGYHSLGLNTTDTSTPAVLTLVITCIAVVSTFVPSAIQVRVVDAGTPELNASDIIHAVCFLQGTLIDAQGLPISNAKVYVRPLPVPGGIPTASLNAGAVAYSELTTETDALGHFSIPVLRGLIADVVVEAVRYRKTITVPSSARANLFSI